MNEVRRPAVNRRASIRQRPRAGVEVACHLGALGLGANVAVALLDLSETGVRLLVSQALRPGEEVEVSLAGQGQGRPFRVPAHVVWCVETATGQFCVGIRFQKYLPYRDLSRLT